MSRNEHTDQAIDLLQDYGIKGWVEERGKHLAVVWKFKDKYRTLIASRTPSDHRSLLNNRTQLMRMLREDGVQKPAPTSFVKAMALPKTNGSAPPAPAAAHVSSKDIDVLLELIADLQSDVKRLNAAIKGGKVRATFTVPLQLDFSVVEPAEPDEVTLDPNRAITALVIPTIEPEAPVLPTKEEPQRVAKKSPKGERGRRVLAALSGGNWVSRQQIIEKAGGRDQEAAVGRAMNQLKHEGKIENGLRGMWRLVP